eukprot:TRINITY_DN50906_c0_g2_i1.p1 TRINITY_DN50906_c0_g2~~TRINITY_DN50906_c0_g2_i1.p1  ORF type:complete len:1245 (-),score=275.93 TRINITY_DN50906_c0_g2_i1:60-3794(-)
MAGEPAVSGGVTAALVRNLQAVCRLALTQQKLLGKRASAAPVSGNGWTCAVCTLDNGTGAVACAACDTPRPPESVAAGASASEVAGEDASALAACYEEVNIAVAYGMEADALPDSVVKLLAQLQRGGEVPASGPAAAAMLPNAEPPLRSQGGASQCRATPDPPVAASKAKVRRPKAAPQVAVQPSVPWLAASPPASVASGASQSSAPAARNPRAMPSRPAGQQVQRSASAGSGVTIDLPVLPGEQLAGGLAEFVASVRQQLTRDNKHCLDLLPVALRGWAIEDAAKFPWVPRLHDMLRQHWGYDSFRGLQLPVINALLSGRDVFAVMPTGSGKSLCYQLPALMKRGTVVVISPLLSLMQDQVSALLELGIAAARLGSDTAPEESSRALEQLRSGELQLLYVSPEKVVGSSDYGRGIVPTLQDKHARGLLPFIVVDEAHCVSQWGHDFRKSYRQLSCLRRSFPNTPILGVTASATDKIELDVQRNLGMRNPLNFRDTFDRKNLFLEVRERTETEAQVMEAIAGLARSTGSARGGACGIVYVLSRKDTSRVAESLRKLGVTASAYHAGMTALAKQKVFDGWKRGKTQVVVATVAFGMGIDKASVRFVCHTTMPSSVGRYHQEIGRAGRDGQPSRCILWRGSADLLRLKKMASTKMEMEQIDEANRLFGDSTRCRRAALLAHFGESYRQRSCDACDVCVRQSMGLGQTMVQKDFAEAARRLLQMVEGLEAYCVTAARLREAACGRVGAETGKGRGTGWQEVARGHPGFGGLRELQKNKLDDIIREMVAKRVLTEKKASLGFKGRRKGRKKFQNSMVTLHIGPQAARLRAGQLPITLSIAVDAPRGAAAVRIRSAAVDVPPEAVGGQAPRAGTSAGSMSRSQLAASDVLGSSQASEGTPRTAAMSRKRATEGQPGDDEKRRRSWASGSVLGAAAAAAARGVSETVAESSGDELVTVGGGYVEEEEDEIEIPDEGHEEAVAAGPSGSLSQNQSRSHSNPYSLLVQGSPSSGSLAAASPRTVRSVGQAQASSAVQHGVAVGRSHGYQAPPAASGCGSSLSSLRPQPLSGNAPTAGSSMRSSGKGNGGKRGRSAEAGFAFGGSLLAPASESPVYAAQRPRLSQAAPPPRLEASPPASTSGGAGSSSSSSSLPARGRVMGFGGVGLIAAPASAPAQQAAASAAASISGGTGSTPPGSALSAPLTSGSSAVRSSAAFAALAQPAAGRALSAEGIGRLGASQPATPATVAVDLD